MNANYESHVLYNAVKIASDYASPANRASQPNSCYFSDEQNAQLLHALFALYVLYTVSGVGKI